VRRAEKDQRLLQLTEACAAAVVILSNEVIRYANPAASASTCGPERLFREVTIGGGAGA
jgi:hypothetical protein